MLLRWMLIGFVLGPYFALLSASSHVHVRAEAQRPANIVTVVDVARGVAAADVSGLVRLAPDERVTAVDDRAVESSLSAGSAIALAVRGGKQFIDLSVEGSAGPRRILLLMH